MFEFLLILALYFLFVFLFRRQQAAHDRRIAAYNIRIHVNGIRGKSTVTRLIAGILRSAGYRTVAKTTGSAAATIGFDGEDLLVSRRGAVNVKEQQDIISNWEPLRAKAMVIECMALQPKYQEWAEKMVIRSHIGIITNVREDHQDVMGETLPEIAISLAQMCPQNGYLITAENNSELQALLRVEAQKRGSILIVAQPERVSNEDISHFDYISFKDNIAIGLAVADLLGINHKTAMRGMEQAKGDIGVVRLQNVTLREKPVTWANLFAVNDRESMVISMQMLEPYCDDKTVKIGILNNRYDRERRAEQFGDVAVKDLKFDWLITFGAYEDLVTRKLIANNYPADRIINLGFSVNPNVEQIIDTIGNLIPKGFNGLLVGFVNIHTPQAELLMEYFNRIKGAPPTTQKPDKVPLMPNEVFEMTHYVVS